MQKKMKVLTVTLSICCAVSIFTNCVLFSRGGYTDKLLVKLGLKEYNAPINWTLESWKSSLDALEIDSDIVFFGDSITRGGQWQTYFPEYKIVNLGISGDSIIGMNNRVDMIASVTPEKIFILGGINSLTDNNAKTVLHDYQTMIENIKEIAPEAQLYIQSVLPISAEKEKICADNAVIDAFNEQLKLLSQKEGAVYIDVYHLYELDGVMNPALTKDGIHLKPDAYERWAEQIKDYITD